MNDKLELSEPEQARVDVVKQYYIRSDQGRADTLDLFTDDVQVYFPKFGIGTGKQALGEMALGLMKALASISHDLFLFNFVVQGESVVVEGVTHGVDHAGTAWKGGETSGGRFCSVFEFRGSLISRMHIYLDPDYTSRDEDRFFWGKNRTW